MNHDRIIADLAVECWKLIQTLERAGQLVNNEAKTRLSAQARYAWGRLDTLLAEGAMKAIAFDGQRFEVNLPAIPMNGEDFSGEDSLLVERTVEPAIISDMRVVRAGKVLLARAGTGAE